MARKIPTRSFKSKVMDLSALQDFARAAHAKGQTIGVTSGVFDIFHPGHASFLEDAHLQCDKLIVIIASDRTVSMAKGDHRPYITAFKRAQTIAALEMVDAVIISDSDYHEDILQVINADKMFKGHDYEDKEIFGSEFVGEVVIIPCAEENFFSSSRLEEAIKNASKDGLPRWVP